MRNMLALFAAAILTVVGLGWYLGWYKLQPALSSTPGHQSVNIDIDGKKLNADLKTGEKKAEKVLDRVLEGTTARGISSPAPVKAAAQ